MKLVLPVSRGVGSFEAAVSGFTRVHEEYDVDEVVLLHVTALEEAKRVEEFIKNKFNGVKVVIKGLSTQAVAEYQESPLPRILRKSILEDSPSLVLVSSAGRRLAASVAIAGVDKEHAILHVNFYWGPWTGLYYPYTPRRLEPIIVMHPSPHATPLPEPRSSADKLPDISVEGCKLPKAGTLPPLRYAVAELARRLNKHPGFVRGPPLTHRCPTLTLEVETMGRWNADLCNLKNVERFIEKLGTALHMWAEGKDHMRLSQILAWTGASPLEFEGDFSGTLIADTNLLYHGIHNYAYEGVKVAIPECAVAEVMSSMAEAVKRRRRDPQSFASILAYLALKEARAHGVNIVPSGPRPCDTGMTRIDPILVQDAVLATSDSGAYNLWTVHPISKLAKLVHVHYKPDQYIKPHPDKPETVSRAYYALHQLIIAVALASKHGILNAKVEAYVEGEEGIVKAQPPTSILLEAVGYKTKTHK